MGRQWPTPQGLEDWAAALGRWVGIAGLVFCTAFWAITNRVEPALVTVFGGALAVGQGARVLAELRRPPEPPEVARASSTSTAEGG